MSLDFTITASSFEGYVPHLKVDWNGSENNYSLVSANMVGAVPEPQTYAMLLAGLLGLAGLKLRRSS
jgi:PEP-CTERM motif-containing protein